MLNQDYRKTNADASKVPDPWVEPRRRPQHQFDARHQGPTASDQRHHTVQTTRLFGTDDGVKSKAGGGVPP